MRRLMNLLGVCMLILSQMRPALAAGPSLTVVEPVNAAVLDTTTVRVTFTTADFTIVPSSVPISDFGKRPDLNRPGQGHVHLTLDLEPLVVWYEAGPYTFADVLPGEHTLMVELVNNDHSSLSPQVMQVIRFRVAEPRMLPVTGTVAEADAYLSYRLLVLATLLLCAGGLLVGRRKVS
jgi:hypothetical protein